jgi:hypothetical protein
MWHEKHSGLYNLAAVIMVVANFRWDLWAEGQDNRRFKWLRISAVQ